MKTEEEINLAAANLLLRDSSMREIVVLKTDLDECLEIIKKYPNIMVASISNSGLAEFGDRIRLTILRKDIIT